LKIYLALLSPLKIKLFYICGKNYYNVACYSKYFNNPSDLLAKFNKLNSFSIVLYNSLISGLANSIIDPVAIINNAL